MRLNHCKTLSAGHGLGSAVRKGATLNAIGNRAEPLLSVITPSLNNATYIRQTIESVLTQDYPHIEHLVIDGGSTDGTVAILREYGCRYPDRFRWISEPDKGQSDALNKGISLARGEFIAWQNADDYYLPNVFAEPIAYLTAHPEVAMVFSQGLTVDATGAIVAQSPGAPFRQAQLLEHEDYARLLKRDYIATQAAFIRRDALLACGGFDVNLHYAMDYDLWLRLGLRYRMAYLPGVRGVWRLLPTVKSAVGFLQSRREVVQIIEGAASDSLLPSHLVPCARTTLQHWLFEAMLQEVLEGEDLRAAALLQKALEHDSMLSEWSYLCRRVLMTPVMARPVVGYVGSGQTVPLPERVLALLYKAGLARSAHARQIVALSHLYLALYSRQRTPRLVVSHLLRAVLADRKWLHYSASKVVLLRLLCGDRVVYVLSALSQALRRVRMASV